MPDYMSLFGALQCHCLKCYSVTVSNAMMSLFEALQRHCFECYDVTVSPILSGSMRLCFIHTGTKIILVLWILYLRMECNSMWVRGQRNCLN